MGVLLICLVVNVGEDIISLALAAFRRYLPGYEDLVDAALIDRCLLNKRLSVDVELSAQIYFFNLYSNVGADV